MKISRPALFTGLIFLILSQIGFAQNVTSLLKVGPFPIDKPLFSEEKDIKGKTFPEKEILSTSYVPADDILPEEKYLFRWLKPEKMKWEKIECGKKSLFHFPASENDYAISYLATYIYADQYLKTEFTLESNGMIEFFLDGKKVITKYSKEGKKEDPVEKKKSLTLETGTHLVLIKVLHEKEKETRLSVSYDIKNDLVESNLRFTLSPLQGMNIKHLLGGTFLSSARISPGGNQVLFRYSKTDYNTKKSESWYEVRDYQGRKIIQSFHQSSVSRLTWAPKKDQLSYLKSNAKKTELWLLETSSGTHKIIALLPENTSSYSWSPDGSFIIYSVSEKPDKPKHDKLVKKLKRPEDAQPWHRGTSNLYYLDVRSSVSVPLTHGHQGYSLKDISPDGKNLIFSSWKSDYSAQPYGIETVFLFDISNRKLDTLWSDRHGSGIQFSPDGKKLLVSSSACIFDSLGLAPDVKGIPSFYDKQIYEFSLKDRKARALSLEFDPSINQTYWNPADKLIYLTATEGSYKRLYTLDPSSLEYKKQETGLDVVNSFSISEYNQRMVFYGSSIAAPLRAYLFDLNKQSYGILSRPEGKKYDKVLTGTQKNWSFVNAGGDSLEAFAYFPPHFDTNKTYPLIVYYYGGVFPTSRAFGGRYPKCLYAAHGYVVLVVEPSGAVGYGQEFSSRHVNNWGLTVADEIIAGTKAFYREHSFIDSTKIGCIGASYGGFMTMLLQTRTDIFEAAISHAGISSLSSYWGEGYWGYSYSAGATTGSFPWNRKDLYIGQSPLFSADKVKTPLLLLHGDDDTNVPPGESTQMYVALKLLGKEVEYIQVKGQNHHIVNTEKRIIWQKSILAWFDKWLKEQDAWWNDLYPETYY